MLWIPNTNSGSAKGVRRKLVTAIGAPISSLAPDSARPKSFDLKIRRLNENRRDDLTVGTWLPSVGLFPAPLL